MSNVEHAIPIRQVRTRQLLAWCVHLYTAMGLVVAAGIAVLTVQGGESAFRWAFLLLLIALFIDSTDGAFARRLRVKDVLPGFDGRRLDDLVDFLIYTCLPLLMMWRAETLSGNRAWWLVVPLLASAYGFCQVSAKTADGYFLGFPSYWNMVAFYLYLLQPPEWLSLALLLLLSLLTFVPARYLYLSQRGNLNRLSRILAGIWGLMLLVILYVMPTGEPGASVLPRQSTTSLVRWLTIVSLFFPAYYLVASWTITLKIRSRKKGEYRGSRHGET
jgi:phosphatidylcholine synthase